MAQREKCSPLSKCSGQHNPALVSDARTCTSVVSLSQQLSLKLQKKQKRPNTQSANHG